MMFTVAFDGSGHETNAHGIAVAGFLSSDEVWSSFEEKWEDRLERDAVPWFRMSEFGLFPGGQ